MENKDTSAGQRTLAAVMFTDVVGFSRRMGEDEEHTLSLMHRDLTLIAALCEGYRGRVVKRTGDGVMALFTCGTDAVECAQEMQRQLSEYARALPDRDVLSHRIGLHLGDVYVTADEVMGDGVNIAQRLQAEAPPGGICISQALHEVVRRRLAIRTVPLGPRRLRNIDEEVHVYQVLAPGDESPGSPDASAARSSSPAQRIFAALGIVGLLLVAGAALMGLRSLRAGSVSHVPLAEAVDTAIAEPEPTPPAGQERTHEPEIGRSDQSQGVAPGSSSSTARSTARERPGPPPPLARGVPPVAASPGSEGEAEAESPEVKQFRDLDFNRDGRLTRQEIPFELRKRLMWADRDGDGAVTLEELKNARERRGRRSQ